jgi:hypothetical protein
MVAFALKWGIRMRALVALGLVGVLLCAPLAAAQPAPAVVATAEGRVADIAVFRAEYLRKDKAYTPAARAEADKRLAVLQTQAASVSQAYFELEISRVVGLADNGHSAFFPGPRSRRYNRVEVRLVPLGDGFYVLRTKAGNTDLLGARLVAIDGKPAAIYRDAARTLAGGTAAWRDRNVGYFLESPDQMHALSLIASSAAATYQFQMRNGAMVERRLTPEPANPDRPRANAERWFFPEAMPAEGNLWRAALTHNVPWALTEPDDPFRWRMADDLNAIVIDLRQNNDGEKQTIASFLKELEDALAAKKPKHAILDMRMNGGGDLNTTRDFMQALPKRVPGRVIALTSPWTFSAAISSVGYLKQAAPDRVTIIGEEVGDRLNFFSEGSIVTLPNSQIELLNATERHDYATGCRGFTDCHEPVVRFPIAVPSLAPAIAAPWTIEAYLAGRDPGMEAAAGTLR